MSDEGAIKVLEHLKSVRISDPTLDLSKTIPDVEAETDVPLYAVTERHDVFSYLACHSFREVQSKAEFLSHFLDCIGGVMLFTTLSDWLSVLRPNEKVLTKLAHNCVFLFYDIALDLAPATKVFKALEFLNCLHLPLRITEDSEFLTVEDLIKENRQNVVRRCCRFSFFICFRNDQFQFYITMLDLYCDDHARLFTGSTTISVPSDASRLCSEQSCLKFLSSLKLYFCRNLSNHTMKGLGSVIGNCKHLSRIEVESGDDSICYLLEQLRNPSKCSLEIGHCDSHTRLTSFGAVHLASLLPRFNSVIVLNLYLRYCCAEALDTLVTSIRYKALAKLTLEDIILTPALATMLGWLLPKLSSLKKLVLSGVDESILQAEQMVALFGGFNKTMPLLKELEFSGFNVRGCLAPLIKSLRFFSNLRKLWLEELNIDEHDQCSLLKNFGSLTRLEVSIDVVMPLDSFHWCSDKDAKIIELGVISLAPALAAMLGRLLPELSSLKKLVLSGVDESILQAELMEALFGRVNKTMPLLKELEFSGFNVRGCLAPLIKSLRFFPNLRKLWLEELNIDEHDHCSLLKSFGFLTRLKVGINGERSVGSFHWCSDKDATIIELGVIGLTPPLAAMLGRLLPELSSLQELTLTGLRRSILKAEEMEALLGGFNKTVPLCRLTFMNSSAGGCLFPLFKSLRFFSNLVQLKLNRLNMDEHDLRDLLESFQFIPNLKLLDLSDNPFGHAVTSLVPHVINLKRLVRLRIDNTGSEEDMNYIRDTVQQALPELHFGDDDDDLYL